MSNVKDLGDWVLFLNNNKYLMMLFVSKKGVEVPADLDTISGLVFMGGGMNVTDPLQWIQDEQALIRIEQFLLGEND
jgi:GMP synthase-like glutamine amidotransferase